MANPLLRCSSIQDWQKKFKITICDYDNRYYVFIYKCLISSNEEIKKDKKTDKRTYTVVAELH